VTREQRRTGDSSAPNEARYRDPSWILAEARRVIAAGFPGTSIPPHITVDVVTQAIERTGFESGGKGRVAAATIRDALLDPDPSAIARVLRGSNLSH
jgi:hypothetical protein